MSTDAEHTRNKPDLLSVEVGFANQVVLDITEEKAMLALFIDTMAHTLCVVELSFGEAALFVSDTACANLLDELVRGGVEDKESVV